MPLMGVVELAHVQVSFFFSVIRVRWVVAADLNRQPLEHESPDGPSSKVAEEGGTAPEAQCPKTQPELAHPFKAPGQKSAR